MSFDVWLDCFKNGAFDTFPVRILEEAIGTSLKSRNGKFWEVSFPDGGGGTICTTEGRDASGFAINRPSGANLYDAIYEVMCRTQTVLSWSFGGAATANPSVIPHLPPEMIKSVGVPTIVHCGEDIIKAIEAS